MLQAISQIATEKSELEAIDCEEKYYLVRERGLGAQIKAFCQREQGG